MRRQSIIVFIYLFIIAVVVTGAVYVEWPQKPLAKHQASGTSISSLNPIANAVLTSLPSPSIGPTPAEAAPTITWTPNQVAEPIGQGTQKALTVSFTTDVTLKNVAVWIVPELQPYVKASPPSFSSISAGAKINLTLTLSASASAPLQTFDGTLHLRDNSGKSQKTYAKPLPITITITNPTANWLTFTNTPAGYIVRYPPDWIVRHNDSLDIFSNVHAPSPLSETALQSESFFGIRLYPNANPSLLPISVWVDQFFSEGFSVDPLSRTFISIAGHEAIQVKTIEIGGERIHLYVSNEDDVVEIIYGLYSIKFLNEYENMLKSISFVQ